MEFNPIKQKYCPYCSSVKAKSQFYPNPVLAGEYLPYCKSCAGAKYREAAKLTGSKWAALWAVCMEMGVPLIRERFNVLKQQYDEDDTKSTKNTPFATYLDLLQDARVKYRGVFDSDMQLSDFIQISDTSDDIAEEDMEEKRKYWNKVWGSGYDADQCARLDDYFEMYTTDIPEMDAGMMLRYRDLCKAELRKFEGDDSKEVTDEILKLMKLLKVDKFDSQEKSDTDRFIDRLIWKIEETEPAEEEDEAKYRDVAGFEASFNNIMRCMQNLLAGTKNYPNIPKSEE